MEFIYIRTTVPALPEAFRVSVSRVPMMRKTAKATLAAIQRKTHEATYELVTESDYKAYRAAQQAALAAVEDNS